MRTTKAQIRLRIHCLDSIISLDSIAEISRLQLASVAAQAGLCLAWSETPKEKFSHGPAQMEKSCDKTGCVVTVLHHDC